MANPISAQQVRDYLSITSTSGQFSTALIGSNINAAFGFLQHRTRRQFEWQGSNVSKTFSTEGRAYLTIPDLISASSVTLSSVALVANQTYWFHPDARQSGVFTGIQVQQFGARYGGHSYLANPEWFDRNLDNPRYANSYSPNDLVIIAQWGWLTYPPELLWATTVMAGWITKRPDAILSGGIQTPEGAIFDLSQLPVEVKAFIADWKIDADAVVSIG